MNKKQLIKAFDKFCQTYRKGNNGEIAFKKYGYEYGLHDGIEAVLEDLVKGGHFCSCGCNRDFEALKEKWLK